MISKVPIDLNGGRTLDFEYLNKTIIWSYIAVNINPSYFRLTNIFH